jgi:Mor family transcriptional regulator
MRRKQSEYLTELQRIVFESLRDGGLNDALAEELSNDVVQAYVDLFGGQLIYVAMCQSAINAERDETIWMEYGAGRSANEIAAKLNMSVQNVYKRLRDMHRTKQLELFND